MRLMIICAYLQRHFSILGQDFWEEEKMNKRIKFIHNFYGIHF